MRYHSAHSKMPHASSSDIAILMSRKLIGQPAAIDAIIPYVQMYRSQLAPEGRPAGVFLLLGPTGTGKTRTVEALAEVLHNNPKKLLRVDCGEFQMEHEVAKLVGAPPGYLGHRETQPMLTQPKLTAVSGESCDLSLVLFDEIEKAAPSMTRLLLGILDKGVLRLGDGALVNFEKTIIFLTSNLGAREMSRCLRPDFGFESIVPRGSGRRPKLEVAAMNAVRKNFSPEFINRIDAVVTYQPLGAEAMTAILDQQIRELQEHIDRRLGSQSFQVEVPARTRRFLLEKGTSQEFGARELKRTLQRHLVQPLASMIAKGEISPGGHIRVELSARRDRLVMRGVEGTLAPAC
ncbi:MAG TPA: AAA family ATPase [Bryobacteraceae bacterium]|nr:AAA family ATPase [Bryobacteraceae bacterium]